MIVKNFSQRMEYQRKLKMKKTISEEVLIFEYHDKIDRAFLSELNGMLQRVFLARSKEISVRTK